MALISRGLTAPPSPLAGWEEDWGWVELTTPAEAVCQRIGADFEDAAAVAPALPVASKRTYLTAA